MLGVGYETRIRIGEYQLAVKPGTTNQHHACTILKESLDILMIQAVKGCRRMQAGKHLKNRYGSLNFLSVMYNALPAQR